MEIIYFLMSLTYQNHVGLLVAINELISNVDLVTSIFRGIGSDHAMLVTAIYRFPTLHLEL